MGQAIKVAKPITRKVEVADHLSIHTCEGEDAMETYTYDVRMFKETFEYGFTYINGFMRNVHRFELARFATGRGRMPNSIEK